MIQVSDRQFRAVAAGAAEREIALVAAQLPGSDPARTDAARAAVRIGRARGLATRADLVTLGEIVLAYGPGAADPGGVAWVTEIVGGAGPGRGRRLRECWSIAARATHRR